MLQGVHMPSLDSFQESVLSVPFVFEAGVLQVLLLHRTFQVSWPLSLGLVLRSALPILL